MAETPPLILAPPFTGRWTTQNSPANRVPSHGTDALGSAYAIDLVAVGPHGRSAPRRWRSLFASEPPDAFVGFGMPILAPAAGTVVLAHDGEPDHEARRSPFTLLPYALTQADRVRRGAAALAGNHVAIALAPAGPFVLLAHLRRGSLCVRAGDAVAVGEQVGECGNSGNSTEPHVHLQVTDSLSWQTARGIPFAFPSPSGDPSGWLPRNGETFEV